MTFQEDYVKGMGWPGLGLFRPPWGLMVFDLKQDFYLSLIWKAEFLEKLDLGF